MQEVMFVLGPVASLLAWRAAMEGAIDPPGEAYHHPDLQRCRADVRLLKRLPAVQALGDVPLDVIVGDHKAVHRLKSLDVIMLGNQLPHGSFNQLDEGLCLCSPELCLALLGRGGPSIHLAELACELCGTYSMAHDESGGFVNCYARSTCEKVTKYLGQLGRRHGIRASREAISLAADKSDSPRETSMFLCLTLPDKHSGYAIARPRLNERLYVSDRSRKSLGHGYLVADELFYDEEGNPVAVGEYDSKQHHFYSKRADSEGREVDVAKILGDDLRREIVRDEGLGMVTVRTEDTKQFERFDAKAMRIGKLAGCEPAPSMGILGRRRAARVLELFDTDRWKREHEQLRSMAGYNRVIRHSRRKGESR